MTLLAETTGVIVVVASAEEISRRIESYLRNAGHPLRTAWVTDSEDLEDALRRNPPDLVICEEGLSSAPHMTVIEMCTTIIPDLPIILLAEHLSIEDTVTALGAGARDVVSCADPRHLRHLELVVVREFVNYHHVRSLMLTRERLADFESRHQQLTAGTADAVAHVQEGILSWANPAFGALLGYENPDEIAGQPLIDLVAPEQQVKVKERLRAVVKGKHNGEPLEFRFAGRTGPRDVKAQLILGQQDGERVIEMLIRGSDMPATKEAGTPATAVAVARRSAFLQALQKPLAKEPGPTAARGALLIVIDNFESLENRIGYVGAEEASAFVANAIRSRLGPDDALFEFSSDELALVVHRPTFSDIEQFGDLLRREIGTLEVATQSHESHVTVSVAVYPVGAQDQPEEVIPQMVSGARELSAKGGNKLIVLGETAKAAQTEREDALRAVQVRKAIEENRLKLAYQSIASLEGEARPHFDVLVRMLDEEGREYHASEFLRAAQKFNLMRPIDRWVVARALTIIEKRAASQESATLFVKLAEDTLRDTESFVNWLHSLLKDRRLKPEEVVFQIQEHAAQNHIRKAKLLAQALVEAGAGVAIEHYGVGSHSAQLLDHLPATFIKFHPSFTQNFADRELQKRLVTLIELAKQKNIKTIVSHIEDANVMARLWQMGVNFVQGYHVQEPEVVLLSSDIGGVR
jgi:PAS domain S-box-containing protein